IYPEGSEQLPADTGALEAQEIAVYNERSAHDFYKNLSETIENPSGQERFKFLYLDEERHRKLLEERYLKESGGKSFVFNPRKVKKVELNINDQASAKEALDIALEAEREAYNSYMKAASKAKDQQGRKMYETLASEEDKHYQVLMSEKQIIEGGFYWFSLDSSGFMED
ncbi:MAG: ferritin family protein, partial [candidate division Zixibacteria bacterium]|nr:ferritin family protein [candidate division Zixibacteria bacterium]